MKCEITYNFDPEKNRKLIELRNISFEEIIAVLDSKGPIDVIAHYSSAYPHQKMYVVELCGYAYLVPFVENNNQIFLKTAFPNRKATQKYLSNKEEEIYD